MILRNKIVQGSLTHFQPKFPFHTTFGFLVFSGGIKRENFPKMS